MIQFPEEKVNRKLELLRRKEEEDTTALLSQKHKIPYADLSDMGIEIDAVKLIPEAKARTGELVVFQKTGRDLRIAVHNPQKDEAKLILKHLDEERYKYDLFLVSRPSLKHAWGYYKKIPQEPDTKSGTIQIKEDKITSLRKEITDLDEIKRRIEAAAQGKTTETLEIILAGALAVEASDVHIEPQRDSIRLRFRLNGMLYDILSFPPHLYKLLLSRIKLVSELKLNIHDKSQDGRFSIKSEQEEIEVRTSVLPGPEGENMVLRILNPKAILVPFEELGLQSWAIKIVERELKKPNGMILTTGPTGSGKTTTLYAFLRKIHSPAVKVITIEDPIEYHLAGIEQTQVNPEKGYDFLNGLKSIVRQDPDVILVGEIRDRETAETAMHAALTGHLVFSTLHANSAAGTIPRLLALGVNPSIVAPAINITMAQRLVRKLCHQCRLSETPSPDFLKTIKEKLAALPKAIPAPPESSWTIFKAKENGCSLCNHTGYQGRIGVFEIILVDEEVEKLILREPSEFEIKKEAARQGQITMQQDALLKVLNGLTAFEEVARVVGEE